jgi:hemerythrin-like domain-containing protein
MFGFFGRSEIAVDRYSPKLIPKLKKEHSALLRLYGNVQDAHNIRDEANVTVLLTDLVAALEEHISTEEAHLYTFIYKTVSPLDPKSKLIDDCRKETEVIAAGLMNLRDQCEALGAGQKLAATFKKDFEDLGALIVRRIKREEESIYPLYEVSGEQGPR